MNATNLNMSNTENNLSLLEQLCDLSYPEIQQTLNKYIQNVTNTKVCFLVPILTISDEMVIHVIGEQILDRELRFPVLNNVLYKTVQGKQTAIADFTMLHEDILSYLQPLCPEANALLTIPIRHPKQNHIALVVALIDNNNMDEIINKYVEVVQELFRFCLGFLLNSLACYEETRLKKQSQYLLAVSRKLFTHLGDFSDLLKEIMIEVRNITNAERCSLFLLDPDQQDLVAKVFDGFAMEDNSQEMRIPIGQGIAGHVATTGKILNIKDAYKHPLFYREIDKTTGFKTRNILCFPIRNETGIIGVAQLCNKKNGLHFDIYDEEVATAFGIYCGISIIHSIVHKKIQDAQARNKLSNEVMMYHMKVEEDAVQALLNCKDKHDMEDFDKFHFSPRSVPYNHTTCYIIRMFKDLGFIDHWKMKLPTLARFILYVQKGYRDAPYHNWTHAFTTSHFAYLLIKNLNLIEENYMSNLQAMVLLVSCICHDIDHRGTNNSFQTKCRTLLANLYSSKGSVMERHHFAQTMCIINTEGCNVFANLESHEYSEALDVLKNNILATDLASHLRNVDKHGEIKHNFNKNDPEHVKLLSSMLMTCSDLSDQTKDWTITKQTAVQIFYEFFLQGDLEKNMGYTPAEMMDRERASIPNLQVEFLSNIVIPLFVNLSTIFPEVQTIISSLNENRFLWEKSITIFEKAMESGMKGVDILLDPAFENEVLQIRRDSHDLPNSTNLQCTYSECNI